MSERAEENHVPIEGEQNEKPEQTVQVEIVDAHDSWKKKRVVIEKELLSLVDAIHQFARVLDDEPALSEPLKHLKSVIPTLLTEIQHDRERIVDHLYSTNRTKQELDVYVGELLFGIEGPTEASQKNELHSIFLSYAAEKLAEISHELFDIELKELEPSANVDVHIPADTAPPTDAAVSIVEEPKTGLIDRFKQFRDTVIDELKSVVELLEFSTERDRMKQKMQKDPTGFCRDVWANALTRNFHKQIPGIDPGRDFRRAGEPSIAKYRLSSDGHLSIKFYTAIQRLQHYDPMNDAFVEKNNEPKELAPYIIREKIPLGNETLLTVQCENIDIARIRQNNAQGKFIPLPEVFHRDEDLLLIPLAFSVLVKSPKKSGEDWVQCPLFYDEAGRLFFDSTAVADDMTVQKTSLQVLPWNKKRHPKIPLDVSLFMVPNKKYFLSEPPAQDVAAAAADVHFSTELKSRFDAWATLPSDAERARAIQNYFTSEYAYPHGKRSIRRIHRQQGRTDVEKIIAAKEGNCFDVNRVGYIVLQKLGIPCEFVTGFNDGAALSDNHSEPKTEFREAPIDIIKGGEKVASIERRINGHKERDVHFSDGHAFLRYVDRQTGDWHMLDLTPHESKEVIERRKIWPTLRDELDRKNGLSSFAEAVARDNAIQEKIDQLTDPFLEAKEQFHWFDFEYKKVYPSALIIPKQTGARLGYRHYIDDSEISTHDNKREQRRDYVSMRREYDAMHHFYELYLSELETELRKIVPKLERAAESVLNNLQPREQTEMFRELREQFVTRKESGESNKTTLLKKCLLRYLTRRSGVTAYLNDTTVQEYFFYNLQNGGFSIGIKDSNKKMTAEEMCKAYIAHIKENDVAINYLIQEFSEAFIKNANQIHTLDDIERIIESSRHGQASPDGHILTHDEWEAYKTEELDSHDADILHAGIRSGGTATKRDGRFGIEVTEPKTGKKYIVRQKIDT